MKGISASKKWAFLAAGSLAILSSRCAEAQFAPAPDAFERPVFQAPATQEAAPVQSAAAQRDYEDAVSRFNDYIASKKAAAKNAGNLPFLLTHGRKTAKVVLMAHGLTDSPYYMRALADVFYEEGYNVVAILIPGHGTRPEDLLHVKLSQWQKEIALGLSAARGLGEEVSLAGFSTGAALVLDAFAKNYARRAPVDGRASVGGLYLFSPALKILDKTVPFACQAPEIVTIFKPYTRSKDEVEDQPYRYTKMAVNAVCQLYYQTLQNSRRRGAILSAIAMNGIGVFAVESDADKLVRADAVSDFMKRLPGGVDKDYILYPKQAGVIHENVTRPELNPFYGELKERLTVFLKKRNQNAASPPAVPPHSETLDRLRDLIEKTR